MGYYNILILPDQVGGHIIATRKVDVRLIDDEHHVVGFVSFRSGTRTTLLPTKLPAPDFP